MAPGYPIAHPTAHLQPRYTPPTEIQCFQSICTSINMSSGTTRCRRERRDGSHARCALLTSLCYTSIIPHMSYARVSLDHDHSGCHDNSTLQFT